MVAVRGGGNVGHAVGQEQRHARGATGGVAMPVRFAGVDGEMSASDIDEGAVLVQIGVAVSRTAVFSSVIGYEPGTYLMDPVSMAVHGISVEAIGSASRPAEVDDALYGWLVDVGVEVSKKALVPVGFNVGGYDMRFVRRFLPRTASVISRRVEDLNSAAYLMGGAVSFEGSTPSSSGWKRIGKARAAQRLAGQGVDAAWHDAGYDAQAALECFWFYREVLGGSTARESD